MVHTGGASLSIGLGITIDFCEVDHVPFTMLDTAYGSGVVPNEDGSSVAQLGRADDRERTEDDPARKRAVGRLADPMRVESIMVGLLI